MMTNENDKTQRQCKRCGTKLLPELVNAGLCSRNCVEGWVHNLTPI